jgi:hypothetical protein
MVVFTTNDDARVMLKKGEKVLLFAVDPDDPKLTSEFNSHFEIFNDCGNSGFASKAQAAIRQLRTMKISEDAEIEGQIFPYGTGAPVSGIHVTIRGGGKSFQAVSGRNGWFHLRVPPGDYSAEVEGDPRWTIVPSSASTNDPNYFTARKGRCAGLEFFATRR